MIKPTKFPPEWLLKKSREECEELKKENSHLREENFEMKMRIQQFTSAHEAKIAIRKEEIYKSMRSQLSAFEKKYYRAMKALSDIKKIAFSVSESSDAVAYVDNICSILIKFYGSNSNQSNSLV